jgi:hypothetical protein
LAAVGFVLRHEILVVIRDNAEGLWEAVGEVAEGLG